MLEFTSCSKHIIENSIGNDHFITNVVSETNKDFLSTTHSTQLGIQPCLDLAGSNLQVEPQSGIILRTSLAGSATLENTSCSRLTFNLRVSLQMLKLELLAQIFKDEII